mmetsp:Transcript_938/g.1711  ORF Transcript_938/g.1711 Transcript_938/m.1711 type:complete len:93 (+) Transcript_938:58-336(+)
MMTTTTRRRRRQYHKFHQRRQSPPIDQESTWKRMIQSLTIWMKKTLTMTWTFDDDEEEQNNFPVLSPAFCGECVYMCDAIILSYIKLASKVS